VAESLFPQTAGELARRGVPHQPFGGIKYRGIGEENGLRAVESFSELQMVPEARQ
jgi:acyl-CoA reductase-like NAD-dependent aldehyde dehydrogenase